VHVLCCAAVAKAQLLTCNFSGASKLWRLLAAIVTYLQTKLCLSDDILVTGMDEMLCVAKELLNFQLYAVSNERAGVVPSNCEICWTTNFYSVAADLPEGSSESILDKRQLLGKL